MNIAPVAQKEAMKWAVIIAGGLLSAYLVYEFLKDEGGAAVRGLGDAVDPLNPGNVFNTYANRLTDRLDDGVDNGSNTVGTAVAGWFGK